MIYIYTSMRPMGTLRVSSRDQNSLIRSYCKKHSISFSLPYPEFVYPQCHIQLFGIIKRSLLDDILVFFSVNQLTDYKFSTEDLSLLLDKSFSDVHFVYEDAHHHRQGKKLLHLLQSLNV